MCVILEEVGYDFRRIFFGLADLLQLSIMRPHTHTHTHTQSLESECYSMKFKIDNR